MVAGISNYNSLAGSGALRDVARVHALDQDSYACSKLVPKLHGRSHSLEDAAAEVPEIERFAVDFPDVWRHSVRLQGVMRSAGTHAAGIIVSGAPLTERGVVIHRDSNSVPQLAWDKRVVEDQGLVKIDVLGLSTLDVLAIARSLIAKSGASVDYIDIPLDDPKVLAAFGAGETIGIFQFESLGMRNLLKALAKKEPLTFDEISAATALYRPGPMESGLMDDYIAARQGVRTVIHEHPNMDACTKNTKGVLVYQEQIMQMARDVAGFSMENADHLRKAMGKKDAASMAKQRDAFVDGCIAHSEMRPDIAQALFDKIEKFAAYAFNLSHSVEYSIISYWAMWLKVYYPQEFYAASMSIAGDDKLPELLLDAGSRGIEVVPPDINVSARVFVPAYDAARDQRTIVTPFNKVLGLSDKTAEYIIQAREESGGKFRSFLDFFNAVNRTKVNKNHQSALDRVGAFAELEFDEGVRSQHKKFPHINLDQLPSRHPDRAKDQIALMPGLISGMIKADRRLDVSAYAKDLLTSTVYIPIIGGDATGACSKCSLAESKHVMPRLGSKAKVMVITDAPSWGEEDKGKMVEGSGSEYVRKALTAAGMSISDCYFTTLVKARKPKGAKALTNEQINGCSGYLDAEIALLRPAIIVALGGATIRHLVKGIKGGYAELIGRIVFDKARDASVVMGLNPAMIYVKPDHQEDLNMIFARVAEMF
jgi:DNA polymerase-3 subunit alpha